MYDLPRVSPAEAGWLEELAQQQLKGCVIWGEKFRHEGKRSIVIAIVTSGATEYLTIKSQFVKLLKSENYEKCC